MSYVWTKFYSAIYDLITDEKPLRERLAEAYLQHIVVISEDNIPEKIKDEFTKLSNDINRAENLGEGTVYATLKQLEDAEILKIVETIISIYGKLSNSEDF